MLIFHFDTLLNSQALSNSSQISLRNYTNNFAMIRIETISSIFKLIFYTNIPAIQRCNRMAGIRNTKLHLRFFILHNKLYRYIFFIHTMSTEQSCRPYAIFAQRIGDSTHNTIKHQIHPQSFLYFNYILTHFFLLYLELQNKCFTGI